MTEKISVAGFDISAYENVTQAAEIIISKHLNVGHMAIAVNPEKIVRAMKDTELAATMRSAEVLYPDGIGVVKAMRKKSGLNINRVPGCELWEQLMWLSAKRHIPVFILGASAQVNRATCDKLKQMGCDVVGAQDGYFDDEAKVIAAIRDSGAKIVSVAMGSPRQEKFIQRCKAAGLTAFFMGVGGTYDVFTGNVKRAPVLFRKLGLEWFYRLACQPSRLFRQRSLVEFMLLYYKGSL
ncbi:WecB/TagA/CpsF family glycosyltransferase [Shewanella sp. FJAT-52076]|uniref:WecB/TagA/CpsF family glycosyltransferase n=1 Tax=Shewanella sp. FJAT-52076 TaxID=2864202 RepID=UPI001C6606CA|nr:WecB/TagA/CpsF family glycosyltransferase [Shewanella sp. FJAT-52076]QYJ74036.1 WecB/TagA/CpsF family glycosyltransferase [Shewanella sp. FJAT-52076]